MKRVLCYTGCALMSMCLVLIVSCATAPDTKGQKSPLPIADQEEMSIQKYNDILELTANANELEVAPKLQEQYRQLIKDYPDSFYAEESYFRLMKHSIKYSWPPNIEAAEGYYMEYVKNYEKPRLLNVMNDYMVRTYYFYEEWTRLVNFLQPYVKHYIETGDAKPVHFMYYYSVAKLNLKEYDEARRGFETVIELFPGSNEATIAHEKLKELNKLIEEIK